MRTVGGELWLWVCRGGVGRALGRSLDAALRRGSEDSREMLPRDEEVGEGGEVVGCDCRLSR
jgi:hypothetical protein